MKRTPNAAAAAGMEQLPPPALEMVAGYFQALAEPTRLEVLNRLRGGEMGVGELAAACGSSNANVSRHLALLMQRGFVARRSQGTNVYYRIADESVYRLCDLVCASIARQFEQAKSFREAFGAAPGSARRGRAR